MDPLHFSPAELIHLKQYPILERGSPRYLDLVTTCQEQLRRTGACELPAFLTTDATKSLASEADRLAPFAFRKYVEGSPYLEQTDPNLPSDHPRRHVEPTEVGVIAYDQFPADSLLKNLYAWDPLMEFLGDALGKEKLYRYADPMGALNLAVMQEGDYLRWHFDQTDFVVSIALQSPIEGGAFEYAPLIRSRDQENYPAVHALLHGDRSAVHHIPMVPGTLLLFEGRHSIHRVTEIKGPTLRHVALLGYDTRPGVTSTPHLHEIRYGRSSPVPPVFAKLYS